MVVPGSRDPKLDNPPTSSNVVSSVSQLLLASCAVIREHPGRCCFFRVVLRVFTMLLPARGLLQYVLPEMCNTMRVLVRSTTANSRSPSHISVHGAKCDGNSAGNRLGTNSQLNSTKSV